jgi:hypothetical protein
MANTRFGDYNVIDYTPLASLVERDQNLLEELGIFDATQAKKLTATWAEFERKTQTKSGILAKARGADRNYAGQDSSRKEMFPVPFFPLDGKITPQDVQNFRMIGTEDTSETVENKVREKVAHIQRSHTDLVKKAMYKAIVSNSTYQPIDAGGTDGGDVRNFSTVWGAARITGGVDLSDQTTDPYDTMEIVIRQPIIANAADNATGYQLIQLVPSNVFSAIVNHVLVRAAYSQYSSEQEPLRKRLGGNSNNRIFTHKGITIVEDISGELTALHGFAMPLGIQDMFGMAYAPADTIDHANMAAEEVYMFMKSDYRSETIESETSFMCHISRPELVADVTYTL